MISGQHIFIDHYILWQEKLPEFVVKKAEKLLYKTEKFRLKEEQKRCWKTKDQSV